MNTQNLKNAQQLVTSFHHLKQNPTSCKTTFCEVLFKSPCNQTPHQRPSFFYDHCFMILGDVSDHGSTVLQLTGALITNLHNSSQCHKCESFMSVHSKTFHVCRQAEPFLSALFHFHRQAESFMFADRLNLSYSQRQYFSLLFFMPIITSGSRLIIWVHVPLKCSFLFKSMFVFNA